MLITALLIAPFLYLGAVVFLIRKKQSRILVLSLFSFSVMGALGFWSITQSRSSTAGIGFLFLPSYASLSGLLVCGFFYLKNQKDKMLKVLAGLLILGNLALCGLFIYDGFATQNKYQQRDQVQAAREKEVVENRKFIQQKILENKDHESEWLNSEIALRENEDTFLIPALESSFVSVQTLERLSHLENSGVLLAIARHPKTTPAILEDLFDKNNPPGYFYQDLAGHANTPPQILRKLHQDSQPIGSVDQALAANPSTPKDILMDISHSKEVYVLFSLMKNPVLDCEMLRSVQESMKNKDLIDYYKAAKNLEAITAEKFQKLCPKS